VIGTKFKLQSSSRQTLSSLHSQHAQRRHALKEPIRYHIGFNFISFHFIQRKKERAPTVRRKKRTERVQKKQFIQCRRHRVRSHHRHRVHDSLIQHQPINDDKNKNDTPSQSKEGDGDRNRGRKTRNCKHNTNRKMKCVAINTPTRIIMKALPRSIDNNSNSKRKCTTKRGGG